MPSLPGADWLRPGPVVSAVSGEGPPLILLHGLAASARWWKHSTPALAASFRVLAFDLPAFGASPRAARFQLDRVPDQLVETMDELGIERASIVGHSMGGLIAAGIAARHPERVDRLVLVDAGFLTFDGSLRRRVTGPVRSLRYASPSLLRVLAEDLLHVGPARMLQATSQLLRADWTPILESITAPTLLVWGDGDTICPPVIADRLAERLPGSRLVTIPDCGHNPMWEHPGPFTDAVLPFLLDAPPPVTA